MGALIGKPAHCRPKEAKRLGYGKSQVGTFLFTARGCVKPARDVRRIRVIGVVCPYCRGPLTRLDPRDGRIDGRVLAMTKPDPNEDRVEVVIDPLPPTHWAATCTTCHTQFCLPKRYPAWARATPMRTPRRSGPPIDARCSGLATRDFDRRRP